eukprot:TRINITY_DN67193_c1_g2_i1.p3 TRINITY_DN67193_c1_g2~~TRINITY_DN67193_c1_g2_i1.p3  ORF type:complete len:112 (+),score=7.83 TRINITY_DN67193_c1_g2_i1:466-801(+)
MVVVWCVAHGILNLHKGDTLMDTITNRYSCMQFRIQSKAKSATIDRGGFVWRTHSLWVCNLNPIPEAWTQSPRHCAGTTGDVQRNISRLQLEKFEGVLLAPSAEDCILIST